VDINTNAYRIVESLTEEIKEDKRRSAASRRAGQVGGPARARSLTGERRREIALAGSRARWTRVSK
jgi:hypothetical protein